MFIQPKDDEDASALAAKLLEAAGDKPERVRTSFQGATLGFEVDDELAGAVGRTPDRLADPQGITRDTVGEPAGEPMLLPNDVPGAVVDGPSTAPAARSRKK